MNKMGLEKNHLKTYFPKTNFPNLSIFLPDIKINFAITQSKAWIWEINFRKLLDFNEIS